MVLTRHRRALTLTDKTALYFRQMKWLMKSRDHYRGPPISKTLLIMDYAVHNLDLIFSFSGHWKRFINSTFERVRYFKEEIKTGKVSEDEPKKTLELEKIMESYTERYDDIRMAVLVTLNRELPPCLSRHIAETYI